MIKKKIIKCFGRTNRRCPDITKISKPGNKQKISVNAVIELMVKNYQH